MQDPDGDHGPDALRSSSGRLLAVVGNNKVVLVIDELGQGIWRDRSSSSGHLDEEAVQPGWAVLGEDLFGGCSVCWSAVDMQFRSVRGVEDDRAREADEVGGCAAGRRQRE